MTFIIGVIVGAAIGFLTASLLNAAPEDSHRIPSLNWEGNFLLFSIGPDF